MKQLLPILLLSMGLFVTACVTSTINSDGTVQKQTVDKVKLSETYVDLAIEYQQRGAPQVALDRINLAIQANPDSPKAYMIRAMIYQNLNQIKDAEKDFKKAIRLDNSYSEAYVNYAVFLCDQKRFDEAIKNFDTALENPLYFTPEVAYYSKGVCYYNNKQLESANADYLRALTYRNPPQNTYVALARLQLDKKNYTLAKYYINKFSGSQTPDIMWLHIQILQSLLDTTNNPRERKEYTSYRDTIGKLLVTNYGDSNAAQQYILKYGGATQSPKDITARDTAVSNSSKSVIIEPKISGSTSVAKDTVQIQPKPAEALKRKYIVVEAGDTLYSISRKSGVSISEIKKINNMSSDKVEIGSKIYLN